MILLILFNRQCIDEIKYKIIEIVKIKYKEKLMNLFKLIFRDMNSLDKEICSNSDLCLGFFSLFKIDLNQGIISSIYNDILKYMQDNRINKEEMKNLLSFSISKEESTNNEFIIHILSIISGDNFNHIDIETFIYLIEIFIDST